MVDIYIIGCGGFAKEVYALINAIGGYSVKGFIDIKEGQNLVFNKDSIPVLEEEKFLKLNIKASIAIGVGEPKLIKKLVSRYNGFDFPNLFHPSVVGDFNNIEIGIGNVFTANVNLTTCIKIGDFNVFNLATTIGHDAEIGNYNVINPCVNISGGVIIGNSNLIGVGAIILQYKKIGSNSIVGASSLVIKDVPDSVTVFGIPAKRL